MLCQDWVGISARSLPASIFHSVSVAVFRQFFDWLVVLCIRWQKTADPALLYFLALLSDNLVLAFRTRCWWAWQIQGFIDVCNFFSSVLTSIWTFSKYENSNWGWTHNSVLWVTATYLLWQVKDINVKSPMFGSCPPNWIMAVLFNCKIANSSLGNSISEQLFCSKVKLEMNCDENSSVWMKLKKEVTSRTLDFCYDSHNSFLCKWK